MKRYLLLLSLFIFCFATLHAQANNTNQTSVTDTIQKKKELAPVPNREESIPASQNVQLKSTKTIIDSKLQDEPSTVDSQAQTQNTFYFNNFQTTYTQAKNNLYQRTPSEANQKKLDASANYFKNTIPTSFESNLLTYKAGNYDQTNYSNLETALNQQPNNQDAQLEYGLANYIQNNSESVDSITTCLINNGYFSEGSLDYANDMVQSIPPNSTLIVHGTTDLLPINKAKQSLGRTDLQVLSIDLLQSEQYRLQLIGQGYQLPESDVIDTNYVRQFCELNQGKSLFLGMGFPKGYLENIKSDLTVVGLSMGYKITGLDSYNWNLNLYKFVWKSDELAKSNDQRSNKLSANYLPALMNLQKQFEWNNRTKDYEEISALINAIGNRSNKLKSIQSIGK